MKTLLCLFSAFAFFTFVEATPREIATPTIVIKPKVKPGWLVFSPNGKLLAVTPDRDDTIKLWDTETGQMKGRIYSPPAQLVGSADVYWAFAGLGGPTFSPDGRTLTAPDFSAREFRLWDVGTGRMALAVKGISDYCYPEFSPDGHLLALPLGALGLKMWDVATRQLRSWHPDGIKGVKELTFEPDGRTFWITVFSDDKPHYSLEHIDLDSGDVISRIIPEAGKRFWHRLTPDGKTIATISDRRIKLWKAATGQLLAVVENPKSYISSHSFGPDGQTWVSGSEGGGVSLWKWNTAELIANLEGKSDGFGKFSPDGALLVTEGSQGLSLRDPHTGELKQLLTGVGYPFAFSRDGSKLAATSRDRTILLWNIVRSN
jgi:WD40 repeat protein